MTGLMTTIPGDIPGLLRKWSPVLVTIDSDNPPVLGVVIDPIIEPDEPDLRCLVWNERNGRDNKAAMFVCLDLTDATGRAHAAWWTLQQHDPAGGWTGFPPPISTEEGEARRLAIMGADMMPIQIDLLARLVLRLAGRTP